MKNLKKMKTRFLTLLSLVIITSAHAQVGGWDPEAIEKAEKAYNVGYHIVDEMDIIALKSGFFKFAKDLTEKDDMEYLTELAKSIGYLTGVSTNVHKTFKHEKRLQVIEEKLKTNLAISMRMFEEPQLEKYR